MDTHTSIAPVSFLRTGARTITSEVFEKTNTAPKTLAWLEGFNNVSHVARTAGFYTFKASSAVASAVVAAGFDLYSDGGAVYFAKRTRGLTVK